MLGSMLGLVLLQPRPVYACSCVMDPRGEAPAAGLQRARAVFAGRVTRVNDLLSGWTGRPVRVTFDVAQVWKGPAERHIMIRTGTGGGDCGIDFRLGEDYIVYAYDAQDPPGTGSGLAANSCSRTDVLADAQADLAAFGAGTAPPQDNSGRPDSVTILGMIALLLAALVLAMRMLVRRRSHAVSQ